MLSPSCLPGQRNEREKQHKKRQKRNWTGVGIREQLLFRSAVGSCTALHCAARVNTKQSLWHFSGIGIIVRAVLILQHAWQG